MRTVGVPFRELFEAYDLMFAETRVRGGPSAEHISDAMCGLVELWLQADSKDLRRSVKSVSDTLVRMLLNNPNPRLSKVQEQLQSAFTIVD